MLKLQETKNEFGLDIIRIFAMFSVIALHYFLHSGYYDIAVSDPSTLLHTSFRSLFYECVPLFLILTGYLKRNAKFEGRHFVKLVPILLNSLLVSIITIVFKILYLHEKWPFLTWAKSVWTFNQPSYGWYANMYLALAVFMPLINGGYQSLKTKKQKLAAVITVACITTLPDALNRIRLPEAWGSTLSVPFGYFGSMWPMAYYLIGCYIAEFRPHPPRILTALGAGLGCFLLALANHLTRDGNFYTGYNIENGDLPNIIIATLLFLTFYNINVKNRVVRWFAAKISALSLTCYLMSYIIDVLFYEHFRPQFTGEYKSVFPFFWKIVPLDFLLSVLVSIPVYLACHYLGKLVMWLVYGRKEQKPAKAAK